MATISEWVNVDGNRVADSVNEARQKLDSAHEELVLDFSAVKRLDAAALDAIEQLLIAAEAKSVKLSLRGLNIDVYKVLKLAQLAPRFAFLS
jgi:anti-anti-sigma regulatory factor